MLGEFSAASSEEATGKDEPVEGLNDDVNEGSRGRDGLSKGDGESLDAPRKSFGERLSGTVTKAYSGIHGAVFPTSVKERRTFDSMNSWLAGQDASSEIYKKVSAHCSHVDSQNLVARLEWHLIHRTRKRA